MSDGFSLVEVMIIVLILGIITTLGLPTLKSGVDKSRLSGAAGEIVTALEFAQLNAMTAGAQTRVTIDTSADTILLERYEISGDIMSGATEIPENDVDNGGFATMGHPVNKGADYYIVFADEDRFHGVDIASAAFDVNNYVTFDVIGAPSDGGSVTLSLGDRQVVVTVDSLTGKVTASE